MIKPMKVLVRDNDFCTKYPGADNDIDNLGGDVGVNDGGYTRFTIAYDKEGLYPNLTIALREIGISDEETVLVEFE